MPKQSAPSVSTGLTLLGYLERRPWLWLVDLDAKAVAPATTSMPGNDVAISAICVRRNWLAVQTHSVLWSLPLGLEGPGHRLHDSFTFVPALDQQAVWVEVRLGDRSRVMAVDGDAHVVNTLELPERWRLHADTPSGFVIENIDAALLATFVGGKVEIVAQDVQALNARSGPLVLWTRRDDAILGLTDVATGRTDEIRHPSVAEWQTSASFSPDGKYLAIGGYADPRQASPPSFADAMAQPYQGRRALMTLIDCTTGTCELMQGQFDNFAWTPTWSTDASWVIFGAPFEGRRLYAFRPTEGVLHTLTFPCQPPLPMLDATGRLTVALDSSVRGPSCSSP